MNSKKETQIAKLMFKKSLKSGSVDSNKVRTIIKLVMGQKLTHPQKVLKTYKRLVESQLKREEIMVESATTIKNEKDFGKHLMAKTGAKRVSYKINPEIVVGTRITHGDWIYDETLDAKLGQLTK